MIVILKAKEMDKLSWNDLENLLDNLTTKGFDIRISGFERHNFSTKDMRNNLQVKLKEKENALTESLDANDQQTPILILHDLANLKILKPSVFLDLDDTMICSANTLSQFIFNYQKSIKKPIDNEKSKENPIDDDIRTLSQKLLSDGSNKDCVSQVEYFIGKYRIDDGYSKEENMTLSRLIVDNFREQMNKTHRLNNTVVNSLCFTLAVLNFYLVNPQTKGLPSKRLTGLHNFFPENAALSSIGTDTQGNYIACRTGGIDSCLMNFHPKTDPGHYFDRFLFASKWIEILKTLRGNGYPVHVCTSATYHKEDIVNLFHEIFKDPNLKTKDVLNRGDQNQDLDKALKKPELISRTVGVNEGIALLCDDQRCYISGLLELSQTAIFCQPNKIMQALGMIEAYNQIVDVYREKLNKLSSEAIGQWGLLKDTTLIKMVAFEGMLGAITNAPKLFRQDLLECARDSPISKKRHISFKEEETEAQRFWQELIENPDDSHAYRGKNFSL